MTDELLLATLARIEAKVDKLANELAELRGAKKAVFGLAAAASVIVSLLVSLWRRP